MAKNLLEDYECPSCKALGRVEEVMVDVTQYSSLSHVEANKKHGCYIDYEGDNSYDGGEVVRFQCIDCGYLIAETEEGLVKQLKAGQKCR